MTLSFHPLSTALGAEVRGIDLSQPLSADDTELLMRGFHAFSLLLFKDQHLTEDQQVRFSAMFGRPSRQGAIQKSAAAITYVSNVRADGTFGEGELPFHSDQTYYDHPMKAIMLYGIDVPEKGGDTLFVNVNRAYRRLPEALKARLATLKVRHHFDYGALQFGSEKKKQVESLKVSAIHDVIEPHPATGAPLIMVNEANVDRILDVSAEESAALVRQLTGLIGAPDNMYRHRWQPNDLVVWDNLALQHARANFPNEQPRTLRRVAIAHDLEPVAA
jgi:taurine dioxygenase